MPDSSMRTIKKRRLVIFGIKTAIIESMDADGYVTVKCPCGYDCGAYFNEPMGGMLDPIELKFHYEHCPKARVKL